MRRWTIILLALAALAQAAYLLAMGRGPHGPEVEQSRARRLLPDLEPEKVRGVSLQRQGEARIALRRTTAGWGITRPLQDRADQARVEELLAALEFADHLRILPEELEGRRLGLEAPRLVLTLDLPGGEQVISFGENDPTGRGVYVAFGGRRLVAEGSLYEVLGRSADELRDRELWPHGADQIQRVALKGMTMTRDGGRWMLRAEGIIARAAPAERVRLISALAGLRAARFTSDPIQPPGGDLVVEGGGHLLKLRYGGTCPGRPAEVLAIQQGPPRRALCLAREDLEILRRGAREFIDQKVTQIGEAEAQEVRLDGPAGGLSLVRDGGYWRITPQLRADDQRLRIWFQQLGEARGEVEVGAESRIKELRSRPRRRVTLVAQSGQRESFVVGEPVKERVPAVREGENTLLWFPAELGALVDWGVEELRSHQILDLSPLDLQRITTLRGSEREVMVNRDGEWWVDDPVRIRADVGHAKELILRLSRLRVERYLPDHLGLPRGAALIKVSIQLRPEASGSGSAGGADRALELELALAGPAAPCSGRMRGVPPFTLRAADCELLAMRRADLDLLAVDDEALREVAVVGPSRRLEAIKRGHRWVDAQERPLSAARMSELLGLLRKLRAHEITGYGAGVLRPAVTVRISHVGQPAQEVKVDGQGRAVVTGRPVRYRLSPELVTVLKGFTGDQLK